MAFGTWLVNKRAEVAWLGISTGRALVPMLDELRKAAVSVRTAQRRIDNARNVRAKAKGNA